MFQDKGVILGIFVLIFVASIMNLILKYDWYVSVIVASIFGIMVGLFIDKIFRR